MAMIRFAAGITYTMYGAPFWTTLGCTGSRNDLPFTLMKKPALPRRTRDTDPVWRSTEHRTHHVPHAAPQHSLRLSGAEAPDAIRREVVLVSMTCLLIHGP